MKSRLEDLFSAIRASFWAVPLLCVMLAVVMACLNRWIDSNLPQALLDSLPAAIDPTDQDNNRSILTAAAGGVLGILGIVFSITITTLVLASQQYGPHLIRTYMQKRFVQISLGIYVGTGLYCLLTLYLMGVRGPDAPVPLFGVSMVPILVTVDLILLVIFIHRTATSMQAENIVSQVQRDFQAQVATLFAERQGDEASVDLSDATLLHEVVSNTGGYVQAIERQALVELAQEHDLLIVLLPRISNYVLNGEVVVRLYRHGSHASDGIDDDCREIINRSLQLNVVVGDLPTPVEDARFSMRQLNQIALRALSPSLNDPMTAMTCLDRQTRIVNTILSYPELSGCFVDDEKVIRLCETVDSHADLIAFAFDQIRVAASAEPFILTHLLNCIRSLATVKHSAPYRDCLQRQYDAVLAHTRALTLTPADQAPLESALRDCRRAVQGQPQIFQGGTAGA